MRFHKLLNTAGPQASKTRMRRQDGLIKSPSNVCWDILCVKERQGVGQCSRVSAQPPGEQEEGVTCPCCSLQSRKSSHTGRRLVFLSPWVTRQINDGCISAGGGHSWSHVGRSCHPFPRDGVSVCIFTALKLTNKPLRPHSHPQPWRRGDRSASTR